MTPQNIVISGANSGIGAALALIYAKKNNNLFLCARNLEKLEKTQKLCQKNGANCFIRAIDVTNSLDVKNWIFEIAQNYKIDLVIANAGISAGTSKGIESFEQINEIFATNLNGVINLTHPACEIMKNNKYGQIAIISSLAGFKGLPSAPAYSASKAAVRVYAEALRGNMSNYNVKVSAICPGYIKTPMTDVNDFWMPMIMSADKCALIIKKGLAKNKSRIAFPLPFYLTILLLSALPLKITDFIFSKLPKKKSL
ncbi:SDR family NAD(P)-dependent oxidoreductase [Rickettsiales bacterium]|nr:SDR family NAD(P)-dependent oxidoreductase [Rickettsiales bacterium]